MPSQRDAKAEPTVAPRGPRREAVKEVRQFVFDNSFANMNTINQSGQFLGFATSQVEYYIDCANSNSTLLSIRVDMSGAFRNVDKGSPASLTIRTGDSPNATTPVELASQKRVVLYGEFIQCDPSDADKSRFFAIHPDARTWEPGRSGFHKTQWVEFQISGIYYIGGFGDKHYIGNVPVDMYKEAKPQPSSVREASDELSSNINEKMPSSREAPSYRKTQPSLPMRSAAPSKGWWFWK